MSDESGEIGNRCMLQLVLNKCLFQKYLKKKKKKKKNKYVLILAFNAPTGADPGEFPREFELIILPYIRYVFGQIGLSKQCRSR